MIAYKVVHSHYRYGTNLMIFFQSELISYHEFLRNTEEKYRKYFPLYLKDSILNAPKNSLGFLLFKRKIDAILFIQKELSSLRTYSMILRIETLSKTKKIQPGQLKISCGSSPQLIYHNGIYRNNSPEGSIGCHKIKVLN